MEKEIEVILREHQFTSDDPDSWTTASIAPTVCAIAKWMREGVGWRGPGRIGEDGTVILISPVSGETYGAFSPWPPGRLEETPIGQRVTVTVTKVG